MLGNEGAGVVEAVGPGVNDVSIGDRVVYADGPLGAYAAVRIYPADRLVRIPDGVSDAQPAASFLRGVTARMPLKEVMSLQRDDVVLFHAAAGGVGLIFSQWARSLGIRVIGAVSSEAEAAAARQAGCFDVIDYMKDDFVARVRDLTGGEDVATVFDSIGRDTFLKSLEVLRPRGVLVAFGQASGSPPPFDPFLLPPKALHVTWPGRHIYTASIRRADGSSKRAPPTCSTPSATAFWKSVRAALMHSTCRRIATSKAARSSEQRQSSHKVARHYRSSRSPPGVLNQGISPGFYRLQSGAHRPYELPPRVELAHSQIVYERPVFARSRQPESTFRVPSASRPRGYLSSWLVGCLGICGRTRITLRQADDAGGGVPRAANVLASIWAVSRRKANENQIGL